MFGLELVDGAVFVAVGDGPVLVLVSEHELDLDAVAPGVGERINELLGLFGADFGEGGAEVEIVAGLQGVGAGAGEAAELRIFGGEVGHGGGYFGRVVDGAVAVQDSAGLGCGHRGAQEVEGPAVGDARPAVTGEGVVVDVGINLDANSMGGFGKGERAVSTDDFGDAYVGALLHPGGQKVGVIGIVGNSLHYGRSPEYQAFRHLTLSSSSWIVARMRRR